MQRENPLFFSALDVRQHGQISLKQRQALQKRLAYSRRVCSSLSRLSRSSEDLQSSRSLSNSCETLSAFSCDDACSDIFYLPYSGLYTPQRCESPSIQFLLQNENFSRLHNSSETESNCHRPEGSVTFSDQVEVIHLSGGSSDSEEEHILPEANPIAAENPFIDANSEDAQEELSEYLNSCLSKSPERNMSSFSDMENFRFADESSGEDEHLKSKDSSSKRTEVLDNQQPVTKSSRAQMNEMRLRFLSGETPPPPSIQIIPPTPTTCSVPTKMVDIPPPASFANSDVAPAKPKFPERMIALDETTASKENSSNSSNYTSSEYTSNSSESDSSTDSSTDSEDEIDADHEKPSTFKIHQDGDDHESEFLPPAPPGFGSDCPTQPISIQIPRKPNKPPPPPPANIPPFQTSKSTQKSIPEMGPAYLETDLDDDYFDPSTDNISEDPLENRSLMPTSRSKSIDDLISGFQDDEKDDDFIATYQENRITINESPKIPPAQFDERISHPFERVEESTFLTPPSWENVDNPVSDDIFRIEEDKIDTMRPNDAATYDVGHEDFALTSCEIPTMTCQEMRLNDANESSNESESDSDSSSSDDSEENFYDPTFQSCKTTSSLPDLLDELDSDDFNSDRRNSDPSYEVIQITSISDLLKFNAEHSQRQRIPRPSAPPPPRPQSHRVAMLKKRGMLGHSSSLNLMGPRSPRLLRKDLANSLPVIFERSESFGDADLKQRPKVVIRNARDSESSRSSSSSSSSSSSEDEDHDLQKKVECAPDPSHRQEFSPETKQNSHSDLSLRIMCELPNDSKNIEEQDNCSEGDDCMTTDLDDLSPAANAIRPPIGRPQILQETDLDEILDFNMDLLNSGSRDIIDDHQSDSSLTVNAGGKYEEDRSTTSESSDSQFGEMEPLEMDFTSDSESRSNDVFTSVSNGILNSEDSDNRSGLPLIGDDASSLRQVLKTSLPKKAKSVSLPTKLSMSAGDDSSEKSVDSRKSPIFNIVLNPNNVKTVAKGDDDHEVDAAPRRTDIRALIADLERKSKPAGEKPKILPKPKPRRDATSAFIRGLQTQNQSTVSHLSTSAFMLNNEKEPKSPSEKENTQRHDRPSSASPRPILRDNLPPKKHTQEKESSKLETKPDYMNDYIPALMTHIASAPSMVPPQVINVYPVYQQNPPPKTAPKPTRAPPPVLPKPAVKPPVAPKPKLPQKPKLNLTPVVETPLPQPNFGDSTKSEQHNQDAEAIKELVEDVVRSRKPVMEEEENAALAREEEMRKRREEERIQEQAQEALRAASRYQRSNEIAGNVIDMDKAIDEATSHISTIDHTLDRITGFNLHFMHTLEGMSDGEVSDIELDSRSVQTNLSLTNQSESKFAPISTTRSLVKPGTSTSVGTAIQSKTPQGQSLATSSAAKPSLSSGHQDKAPVSGSKDASKPWETDSLSSDSSSESSSYTDSSYSSSTSGSSDEEEPPQPPPPPPVRQTTTIKPPPQPAEEEAIRMTAAHSSRAPRPPPQEMKPGASHSPRDISNNPFRTRPLEDDSFSIASSTMSRPEQLGMADKVNRFENAIKRAGGRGPPPPLRPPRNPFADRYQEQGTRQTHYPPADYVNTSPTDHRGYPLPPADYVNTSQTSEFHDHAYPPSSDYMNTPPQPAEKFRNPIPKPRTVGSSAESVESPKHDPRARHHRHRKDNDTNEERHLTHHHHKKKRDSRHREKEDDAKHELHYASSLVDIHGKSAEGTRRNEEMEKKKMIRDADRRANQTQSNTLSIERQRKHQESLDRRANDDSVFFDTSTTLTRRRPQAGGLKDPTRSSVVYQDSDEDDDAYVGQSGNRVTNLFKKKRLGEKDKKSLAASSKTGSLSTRGGESNPHQRSLSVDARARKHRHVDEYKSMESLVTGPGARGTQVRHSERRRQVRRQESGEWEPTMDFEDDEDHRNMDMRRRSAGDGFYAGRDPRDRSLQNTRNKAQSEDHLAYDPNKSQRMRPNRESATYFDFDSNDDDSNDSEFDSPRIERGRRSPDEYVNLPSRHGRSKSFDVLQDPKPPPRGFDESLPGRLIRGRPGKSGPGSVASSMLSVGDVRGKDMGELHRMVQSYLDKGRAEKLRTLLRALMIEDRAKMERLMSGFSDDLRQLLDRWSTDRGNTSSSDLLLSTLLLHGAGASSQRQGFGPGLHGAPSMATILRTVYMKPDDHEEPPPGMRPPPRPSPPAMGKASLISDELSRVDELAQEVANYDQTTFKELIDVLTHNCKTEVEKVRALFCWLTVKDLTRLDFDPYAPTESLLGMLRSVKLGEISYHDLFRRLCHYCGIHCEIIFGYSKGAGYRPGMNLKDTRMFENQWTAVYVANSWRFVNVAWGTPREKPTDPTDTNAIRQGNRDDFYFLTDPEQHIFEHFPYQKRWQLMKRPITLEKFMNLPVLKSSFFNAGLTLKKAYQESLTTKDGRVTVRLVMPRFVGISCSLENRADMAELKGLTLVRVMGEEVAILANPSQPGRYYLNIYISSPDDWKDTTRILAASFQIRCSEHNYDRLVVGRFPPVGFLGRTPASQKFGISVVGNPDPLIVWNEKDVVRIPLAVSPGLKLMHRMKCFERHGKDSRDCQEYAIVQTRGKRTAYCIRCPANGYYYITLYACMVQSQINSPVADLLPDGLECVHSFLIDCRRPMTGAPPFPLQSSRWNGCYLMEPSHRLLEVNRKYTFRLEAPHCSKVAVVVNGRNWLDLKQNKSGVWFGKIFTGEELGELSVYGMFTSGKRPRRRPDVDDPDDDPGDSEENYDKVLDFEIVVRQSNR